MSLLATRRPIFNRTGQVLAYELLFGADLDRLIRANRHDRASLETIADTILSRGLEPLANGEQAFLGFSRDALLAGLATLLPADVIVVEISDRIQADRQVIEACEHLRRSGYRLALDDFLSSPRPSGLLRVADVVKIDFRSASPRTRELLARILVRKGLQLIAAGIETDWDHREALGLGYAGLQGSFFEKPRFVSVAEIPPPRPT